MFFYLSALRFGESFQRIESYAKYVPSMCDMWVMGINMVKIPRNSTVIV